jgi:hypothetical protein
VVTGDLFAVEEIEVCGVVRFVLESCVEGICCDGV